MSALPSALAWALIHFLWQGTLLGLGTLVMLHFLTRPQARYALACGALLLCLVLPMIGFLRGLSSASRSRIPSRLQTQSQVVLAFPAQSGDAAPMPTLATRTEAALRPHLSWIALGWSLGCLLLTLRLAWGLAWVQALGTRHTEDVDEVWRERLHALAKRVGLERVVLLRGSSAIASPLTVGWWRPVILVPTSLLAGMPPELLEALLAHELAHILRHDYLVNLLQSAVEVLLFYHPAVWLISTRIRIEREQIADALAAKALGEPRRLALALQELDLAQLHSPQLAQAAHGGHLMARIRQLIQPSPRPLAWKTVVSLVGVASICAALTARSLTTRIADTSGKATTLVAASVPMQNPSSTHEPGKGEMASETRWVLSRKVNAYTWMTGSMCPLSGPELKEMEKADKAGKDTVLLFRQGRRSYIIDDPEFLRDLAAKCKPFEEMGEKFRTLLQQRNTVKSELKAAKKAHKAEVLTAKTQELAGLDQQVKEMKQAQEELGARNYGDFVVQSLIPEAIEKGKARLVAHRG